MAVVTRGGRGFHLAMVGVGPGAERRSVRYFAWCETCASGSPLYDHDVARDLVALHLVDPEHAPVRSELEADSIRDRARDELGEPTPWL